MNRLKKIVVIGPESTGKSTLCQQLSAHFKTAWVKEYAREYLLANGNEYTYPSLLDIAKGQIEKENDATNQALQQNHSAIFIDTDMYIMKVWCEFVFDKCHHWILNKIVEQQYDLYLLCDVDLPWVKDELREYPDLLTRNKLYHHYKDIMVNQQVAWVNISGNYTERLQKAIEAVNSVL